MLSISGTFIPRPELAFRVGITGARNLAGDALPRLTAQLDELLTFLQGQLRQFAARMAESGLYAEAAPRMRLLSPLAEGADRLAAQRALALGYQLEAPLPFRAELYEQDFPETVTEFRNLLDRSEGRVLELQATRGAADNACYEAVGRLVARNCDLLIAIWDGEQANGRGGTAEIVRFAARHNQPIWWLHATVDSDPIWVEHPQALDRPDAYPCGENAFACLHAHLEKTILPHPEARERVHGFIGAMLRWVNRAAPTDPISAMLAEQPLPQCWLWQMHQRVMRLAAHGWSTPPPQPSESKPAAAADRVWDYWQAFFAPLDQTAISYGARYRSSYVLVFFLAALALGGAVVGVGFHVFARAATSFELLCLAGIFAIVVANENQRWHARLITYRLLAELLRKQQALAMFAWSLPAADVAEVAGGEEELPAPASRDALVGWYFNAVLRAAPLPQGLLAGPRLRADYEGVTASLVEGQAGYHARRREEAEAASQQFGRLAAGFFIVTLVIVGIKVFFLWGALIWHHLKGGVDKWSPVASMVAAVPPVLSAAFVGIRSYAELELLADQSQQMQRLVVQAKARLRKLDLDAPLASQTLGAEILLLAEGMLLDIKGWAQLFRLKVVEAG
jgi:hypothetical protein